jgi:hypothetical protein
VPAVVVNGTLVAEDGEVLPEIGRTVGAGQFLRATATASAEQTDRPGSPLRTSTSQRQSERLPTDRAAFVSADNN